ncbi:MAG: type II toxin-antitoxin system RelE/ParE family toxin [Dehalococcoidia bacterium]
MAASVGWTPRARDDLEAARLFIARDSLRAAAMLVGRVYSAVSHLEEFPLSGRVVPEYGEQSIREVIVRPYRIFYEVEGDRVRILAVHHSARQIPDL